MPNDCYNNLTITSFDNPTELHTLIQNEFMNDDHIYHETIKVSKKGQRGISLTQYTAWNPDFQWLESLITKYPTCWIKNEWIEEGGNAGVWIGFMKNNNPVIKHLEWDDLCLEADSYCFLDEVQ